MAFTQKLLNASISLANGKFGASGNNTAELKGHRISARILAAGGQSNGTAEIAIYGLPLKTMNQLTTLGTQVNFYNKNSITLSAGDDQQAMSIVFQGTIHIAYADMRAAPDVCLRISAHAGLLPAVMPAKPVSQGGSVDVAQTMQTIAKSAGLQFENNGVSGKLRDIYLPYNPRVQALELAQMAGIEHIIDRDTLAIWPKNSSRSGDTPLISPETGLVGYPAYNSGGIQITTLFNPQIKPGGTVEVKSDLTPACGKWKVFNLEYMLDSLVPHGKWFNKFDGSQLGATQ